MMELPFSWLGRVPYGEALCLQRERREAVIDGRDGPVLFLLEHDPVVTVGRRGPWGVPPAEVLRAHGIDYFETERGGLATYHGPGQLVGYLICDIQKLGLGVRDCVAAIEQGLFDWLGKKGVVGGRREGYPGVWVGREKLAAIGLNFSRNVSMHGFALNLTVDLAPFGLIVPCGITDGGVTSLEHLLGPAEVPDPAAAASEVGAAVVASLTRRRTAGPADLPTLEASATKPTTS
jgi:lipoyl(octanoyl) transferase